MPRRLLFALLVLVAAPLALLGWLSASTQRAQQQRAREQLDSFFQSRLSEIDRSLAKIFDDYERELESIVGDATDAIESLRTLERESPIVRAGFYVNDRGLLVYPSEPVASDGERVRLYASIPAIIGNRPDLRSGESADDVANDAGTSSTGSDAASAIARIIANKSLGRGSTTEPKSKSSPVTKSSSTKKADRASQIAPSQKSPSQIVPSQGNLQRSLGRWQVWYMDEGVQLIYWIPQRRAAAGILLERARWVADLTADLPDSTNAMAPERSPSAPSGFTALSDEQREIVYRWGDNSDPVDPPLATRSLSAPLTSWRLEYHSDNPLSNSTSTAMVASLAGIGIVLLSLGAYVLTGVQRQMRAARNRVSFASQVSHELRTPLTNIRLYAELAESDLEKLPDNESRASVERRLQVIDSESRRLGRLVSGVLEMIRDTRKPQGPRITAAIPDEIIRQTLMQFQPSFQHANLSIESQLDAGRVVGIDTDILEMILVNLLSNVEKYASDGETAKVASRMEARELVVQVADDGPGIAWRHRRRIFRPFSRLDDSISAPSGTGIGLAIARRLARRHGGELELVACDRGACFELRIPTRDVDESTTEVQEQRDP